MDITLSAYSPGKLAVPLFGSQAAIVFEVYQDVRVGQVAPDPLLETIGDLVRLSERGVGLELQVEVYVPLRAALARPELVVAPDLRVTLCLSVDYALDETQLLLRQALVQKDAGTTRDQTKRS